MFRNVLLSFITVTTLSFISSPALNRNSLSKMSMLDVSRNVVKKVLAVETPEVGQASLLQYFANVEKLLGREQVLWSAGALGP